MDKTINLECFLDDVSEILLKTIKETETFEMQIKAEIIYNKYLQLYPTTKYHNVGYSM